MMKIPVLLLITMSLSQPSTLKRKLAELADPDKAVSDAANAFFMQEWTKNNKNTVPILVEEGCKDKNFIIKLASIRILGRLQEISAIPTMEQILFDEKEDDHIRGAAANSLGLIGPKSIPVLARGLQSKEERIRILSVGGLSRIDGKTVGLVEVIFGAFKDPSLNVMRAGIEAFECLGEASAPALEAKLKDQDNRVRIYSASALLRIGIENRKMEDVFAAALESPDDVVRLRAAESARDLKRITPVIVPRLGKCLQDRNPNVRGWAAAALAKLGAKAEFAVPILIKNLKYPDSGVRLWAAHALGKIGPKAKMAVPNLVLLLKDEGDLVADSAVTALGEIGPDAKEAIPHLKAFQRSRPDLQEDILRALHMILAP
jgi:HEAT repeat protein